MATTDLERAEHSVEAQSASLKKPLGLWDLVMTQIVFVVGSMWVGTAAKLGQAHLFFWLLKLAEKRFAHWAANFNSGTCSNFFQSGAMKCHHSVRNP